MKELLSLKLLEDENGMLVIETEDDSPSAEMFDQLIRCLGQVRSGMKPPVPATCEPLLLKVLPTIPDPGFSAAMMFEVGPVLLLRHPGFGWMALKMDQQRLDTLRSLASQVLSDLSQDRAGPLN